MQCFIFKIVLVGFQLISLSQNSQVGNYFERKSTDVQIEGEWCKKIFKDEQKSLTPSMIIDV